MIARCFSPLRQILAATGMVLVSVAAAPAADIPASKKTTLGLYLRAVEASQAVSGDAGKVLFIDVRTPSELIFVGSAAEIDANIPFVDLAQPLTWDERSNRPLLLPNKEFVSAVEQRLQAKSLGKSDRVIVMCRSGDRSAKAVDVLARAGFTNAWTVIDGFEGDASKEGRRDVNGWMNSGLPWTFKLDRAKMGL